MNQQKPNYQSYLLRLRRAQNANWPDWWASLESTTDGGHHSFAGLDSLFAFLKAQTGDGIPGDAVQAVVALVESLEAGNPQASLHLARLLQAGWDDALIPLTRAIAQRLGVSSEAAHAALVGAMRDCCPSQTGSMPDASPLISSYSNDKS